jgi:hypothetical protein
MHTGSPTSFPATTPHPHHHSSSLTTIHHSPLTTTHTTHHHRYNYHNDYVTDLAWTADHEGNGAHIILYSSSTDKTLHRNAVSTADWR